MPQDSQDEMRRARQARRESLIRSFHLPQNCPPPQVFSCKDYPQYFCSGGLESLLTPVKHVGAVSFTQGAFGTVSLYIEKDSQQSFAVKTVHITERKLLEVCIREFETLKSLSHPNIVSVYRLVLDETQGHIVQDFIAGKSLAAMLTQGAVFTEAEIRLVAMQLFSALHYLHKRRIMHRDVNPANIMLEGCRVVLVDFETACREDDGGIHSLAGTHHWQAPEMWVPQGYDSKVDVWSAGKTLKHLATEALSPLASEFITMCMADDPGARLTAEQALNHPWLFS